MLSPAPQANLKINETMEIITFIKHGTQTPRVGALFGKEYILDFQQAAANSGPVSSILQWFDLDGRALQEASKVYESLAASNRNNDAAVAEGLLVERSKVHMFAPVPRPGKLICIGLNYRDHAAESKMAIPERPVVFSKFSTSVVAPGAPVVLPDSSKQVDYEAELAVVIGRRCKGVKASRAYTHVLGYSIINDVSARDFQFADGQWQRGKSCDTFAPLGPTIVTTSVVPDPHKLSIKLRLNGKTMQDSNTEQLIFGVPELIEFLSETITLEPGDVIATGTPPGVGFARNPPIFLKPGDVMEVEIEKLGILRTPITGSD
jgi:2-keto-4-pentenoate hydratase/2-oxohepta-3-ene-1,7-dioic acid hydratase in catechol pathway